MSDSKSKIDGAARAPARSGGEKETYDPIDAAQDDQSEIVLTAATVAVVGVGAAILEAALLPGIVLGVAAMVVPRLLPGLGASLTPLFRSTVRGAYRVGQRTKEMVAEAQEHVTDIVAEVNAEADKAPLKPSVASAA